MSTEQHQTAEHTGVAAVVDEAKERFTREWDTLKAHAKAAFTKLTEEDLESVKGRFDELRQQVVKAYGYAESHAHDEITKLFHLGESTEKAASTATAAPAVATRSAATPAPSPSSGRKKSRGAKRHARVAKSEAR